MSLLTLERSSPSPHESENDDLLSTSSYEGFVARKHYAMCLSPRPITSLGPGKNGEQLNIYLHLKKLVKLIRSEDMLRLAVELENSMPRSVTKYLVIITTTGHQDTEEAIALGTEQEGTTVRLCLVLPLWRDTEIKLDGDGGFSVHTADRHHIFKPTSVQSMWTALQTLYKATENARKYNHYVGGLSHTWLTYYQSRLTGDGSIINEWSVMEDVESFRPDSPIYTSDMENWNEERAQFEKLLVQKLREIMLQVDLEEVNSRMVRQEVEKEMSMQLTEYKGFLDIQMLRIFGQMERPSKIHDYLYLGSEWNASNLDELKELGVKYILNISREIDNFYPEEFKYLNVRLYDIPASELIRHWDKTYQFIKEAKESGKKVLVHCKMGISRSAATVIAYTMKEYRKSLKEAIDIVRGKRSVINPNDGFINQLKAYEGILRARHNELWGKMAPSRLRPLTSQMRSRSEPNLQESIMRDRIVEPELSFLDEEDLEIGPTSPKHHHPAARPGHWSMSVATSMCQLPPSHSILPVDKEATIRSFLDSLPPHPPAAEDDQGIGSENVYTCTSDSGSGFSSPILTPTDEDHFNIPSDIKHSKPCNKNSNNSEITSPAKPLPILNGSLPTTESITPRLKGSPPTTESITPQLKGSPPKTESITPRLKGSPPTTTELMVERRQPVALANQRSFTYVPSKAIRSSSLPKGLTSSVLSAQRDSLVLESSKSSPVPVVQEESEEQAIDNSSSVRRNSADEVLGTRSEEERQHRRVKSEESASGTVKDPQIQSVPERVKQIESMNNSKQSTPVEFAIAGDDEEDMNSSQHSLPSSSSSVEDRELEQIALSSLPTVVTATRHTSLSPKPRQEHARQSSLSLPLSSDGLNEEKMASALMGAVKARVLDIEERNKYTSAVRKSSASSGSEDNQEKPVDVEPSPESREVVIRRHTGTSEARPSSEVIPNPRPRMGRRDSTPPELLYAWSRWISVDDIPSRPVGDLKRRFEDSDSISTASSTASNPRTSAVKKGSNLRRSQSLRNVKSFNKRKFYPKPKPLQLTQPDFVVPDVATPDSDKPGSQP